MANMSYCRFENTSFDLEDCVRAMEDAPTLSDLDLSKTELDHFKYMRNLCQQFIEHSIRLHKAEPHQFDDDDQLMDEEY